MLDRTHNRNTRQVQVEREPGFSIGLGRIATTGSRQYGNCRGYSFPMTVGDSVSEQEVATISAAITARELSEHQNQALSAATIYPDSSLPSYNQGY